MVALQELYFTRLSRPKYQFVHYHTRITSYHCQKRPSHQSLLQFARSVVGFISYRPLRYMTLVMSVILPGYKPSYWTLTTLHIILQELSRTNHSRIYLPTICTYNIVPTIELEPEEQDPKQPVSQKGLPLVTANLQHHHISAHRHSS